jgi:D-beta-D-heptose 7-phosphate kinase/D-beta-D-heptose 1-phosphate adenosyltransferase
MPGIVEELHQAGKQVAFTNGCFDLLHIGHVQLIQYAAAQADALIVGLNSDESARALKGPGRPVNNEQVRSRILASMADVDYVVLFDETSVLPLLKQIKPDVLVKGGDYPKEGVVGWEFVESYGGEVRLAPLAEGFSTTELIRKISQNHEG